MSELACEAVRAALLLDVAQARMPHPERRVREGLHLGEQAVMEVPLEDDPRAWIVKVLAALAKLRAETHDDDDGRVYGGIATVRRAAEELRDQL
jgi:hypothetical protein